MVLLCFPVLPLKMATSFSIQEVCNVMRENLSMEETRYLVFQMGVKRNILDDIAANYIEENKRIHFVQAWLDITPDASWDNLVTGLKRVDKTAMAADIESKYLRNSQAPSNGFSSPLPSSSVTAPESAPIDPLPHLIQTFVERLTAIIQSIFKIFGCYCNSEIIFHMNIFSPEFEPGTVSIMHS